MNSLKKGVSLKRPILFIKHIPHLSFKPFSDYIIESTID